MGSNRRAFLMFAGAAPAAAAAAGMVSARATQSTNAGIPTRSEFLRCIGDSFAFESGPFEGRPATLTKVAPLEQGGARVASEGQFRLVFEPTAAGTIPQQTYTVTHPGLGRFALFVSPNDGEGRVVEAVFNRL